MGNLGFRAFLFTAGLLLAATSQAQAPAKQQETYPSRGIRLIVPFAPGAGADFTARTVGQKLSEAFAQPVVVENRPGANGILGTEGLIKSSPDGYTLLLTARDTLCVNPSLYKKLSYDPLSSFEYVGIAAWGPYVVVVNPKLPVTTLNELVALAKAKPRELTYGSFGAGSFPHIGFEALNAKMGIDLLHIPYKSASLAVTGVVAGEVSVSASSAAGVIGQIRAGKLVPIAVGSPRRSPLLPNVPTLIEAGVGDELLPPTFFAFALPAGTPKPIVFKLSTEIHRIVNSKETAQRLIEAGLEPFGSTSEEMSEIVKRDVPRFQQATKAIGIQPE
jgi:tripartite-type tricarboxylate transporter receptor subunit TctC